MSTAPRPVIGIISCNRVDDGEPSFSVVRRYVEAVAHYSGCAALIVPSLPDAMTAAEVEPRLDGLLLTGSASNVAPARYGDDGPGSGPFDPERDTMAFDLVAAMRAAGKPVLGICRGFQELNVIFGGTLRRDLGDRHHAALPCDLDTMFSHRHAVDLTPGGALAMAYGSPSLTVNSVHFQGVDRLGDGLTVEATSSEGVVEAFTAPNLLAVQWHPEWGTEDDADAQRVFAMFGEMLRK